MIPYPDQDTAIDAIIASKDKRRIKVIMACGTGKTEVARWAAAELFADVVLVMVPSIALVKQTWDRWLTMGWRGRGLAVCSDRSARGRDDLRVADAGLPAVSTDPAEIGAFLLSPGVVFCTYHSGAVLAEAMRIAGVTADLMICDEAHRLAGRIDKAFAVALDDAAMPTRLRLFMTATEKFYSDKIDAAISMADASLFGETVHRYTFGQAIRDGRLSDYQVVIVSVPSPEIRDRIVAQDRGDDAAVVAVAKCLKRYGLRQVLTFHSRIHRARWFAANLAHAATVIEGDDAPALPVWAEHIDGRMDMDQRGEKLAQLLVDGRHNIVATVDTVTEGVDIPTLDAVVIVDPRWSAIRIIQNVGRALRLSKDGRIATIVLPVYVAEGEDPDAVVDGTEFKQIMGVLRALRAHDERLEAKLKWLAGKGGGGSDPEPDGPVIIVDLPADIAAVLRPVLASRSSPDPWMDRAMDVRSRWPDALTPEDGGWLSTQRMLYRKGVLGREHAESLARWHGWPGWESKSGDKVARAMAIRAAWPRSITHLDLAWVRRTRDGVVDSEDAQALDVLGEIVAYSDVHGRTLNCILGARGLSADDLTPNTRHSIREAIDGGKIDRDAVVAILGATAVDRIYEMRGRGIAAAPRQCARPGCGKTFAPMIGRANDLCRECRRPPRPYVRRRHQKVATPEAHR